MGETALQPLIIGRHRIWPPLLLAPMAGATDSVLRVLCKRQVASDWRKWGGIRNVQIICYGPVGTGLPVYAIERVLIGVCEIRDTA